MEKIMKKGRIILLLCTITILAGCAGNENQKHQDGQEIATIDFHDLQNQEIQNQEIQNQEGGFSETDQQQENNTNSSTSENDDNTQNAIAAEPLESSSKAPVPQPQ